MTDKTEAQRLAAQLTSQVEAGGGDLAELEDAAALLLKQEAAIKVLREALAKIIASRDARAFDRETVSVIPEAGEIWNPTASYVDSSVIAEGRAALTATEGL